MPDQFISEPIQPDKSTFDTGRMAAGEPGLPRKFRWRNKTITIDRVESTRRETKKCRHGSSDIYVRKHWYTVKTSEGMTMKIYFDRQPEGGNKNMGWWLFSIRKSDEEGNKT